MIDFELLQRDKRHTLINQIVSYEICNRVRLIDIINNKARIVAKIRYVDDCGTPLKTIGYLDKYKIIRPDRLSYVVGIENVISDLESHIDLYKDGETTIDGHSFKEVSECLEIIHTDHEGVIGLRHVSGNKYESFDFYDDPQMIPAFVIETEWNTIWHAWHSKFLRAKIAWSDEYPDSIFEHIKSNIYLKSTRTRNNPIINRITNEIST